MEEGRGANSASNAGGGGWPLGLQPLQVVNRLAAAATSRELQLFNLLHYTRRNHSAADLHVLRFNHMVGAASPFFISTPSISSLSSSDLDTESTGSFFPERSTTLGTLIGIHTRPHHHHQVTRPPLHNVTSQELLHSKHHLKATQRLHACCCAAFALLMRCASSSHDHPGNEEYSLSPSLAHLLELERRSTHTSLQDHQAVVSQCGSFDDEEITFEDVGECSSHRLSSARLNTLFDDDGVLPPPPAVALRQFATSPSISSYLSTDWSASLPIVRKRGHSRCPRFWKIGY